jgi:hypothetical protein
MVVCQGSLALIGTHLGDVEPSHWDEWERLSLHYGRLAPLHDNLLERRQCFGIAPAPDAEEVPVGLFGVIQLVKRVQWVLGLVAAVQVHEKGWGH